MKAIFWFITVLWFLGCWYYYTCKIKQACPWTTSTEKVNDLDEITAHDVGPLSFSWSSPSPDTVHFKRYRDSIANSLETNELITITGLYHPDEPNETDFSDLGIARANQIKNLFAEVVEMDRIQIASSTSNALTRDQPFHAVQFATHDDDEVVRELENKALIYFPSASNEMIRNQEINNYLEEVSDLLKGSPATKVKLTGHTDNSGAAEINQRLGRDRANRIRAILIANGVSNNQIIVTSEGENQPIADNTSEVGRRQNRRVELEILE